MELLKELVVLIKDLPDLAIWIIAIFFFYKAFIIGSIYGVLRLAIVKAHDAYTVKETKPKKYTINNRLLLSDVEEGDVEELFKSWLKNKNCSGSLYIHKGDIVKMCMVLEEYKEGEK